MNNIEFMEKEIKRFKKLFAIMPSSETMYENGEGTEEFHRIMKRLKTLQKIKSDLEEYQKLKEKATPQKPVERKETDIIVGEYTAYDCPCCKYEQVITLPNGNIVGVKRKYCGECGTALDWRKK